MVITMLLTNKADWLEECAKTRANWVDMAQGEEQVMQYLHLYCHHDPLTGDATGNGHTSIFATFFGENGDVSIEEAKDMFAHMVRIQAMAGDGYATIFLAEAWMSQGSEDAPPATPPRDDPNRTEALICIAQHRDFGSMMWVAPVVSEDGERVIQQWEERPGLSGGRMHNLVPPSTPAEELQVLARAMLHASKGAGLQEL